MATSAFISKLETINHQTIQLQEHISSSRPLILGRQITVQNVEESHILINGVYQNLMNEMSTLKTNIAEGTTFSNQDDMFLFTLQLTELETQAETIFNQYNDKVLTHYPTARINYGRACVGPKIAPQVDTRNRRFQELLSNSACMREIRGDGNCFLTAFTTRFLENLVQENAIEPFLEFLSRDGIDDGDLKTSIVDTLLNINEYPSQMENTLKDNQKILPFVNYFRQIAAKEMKTHEDDYKPFLLSDIQDVYRGSIDNIPYNTLVDTYTLQMGTDFSHPMIAALCKVLQFPVTIVDPKIGAGQGLSILDNLPSKGTFCRNAEHYFVLYTRDESVPVAHAAPIIPIREIPRPTDIVIKCDVPFGHNLFIRGSGNDLSWENGKGIPLIQIDEDTWIFRSTTPLQDIEYKFLIDDEIWETGANHRIIEGKLDENQPHFVIPVSENFQVNLEGQRPLRTTRITVNYPTNGQDKLFIRGTAPEMNNWTQGLEMKKLGNNLWIWETQSDFDNFEFKILRNNRDYEVGANSRIDGGKRSEFSPRFE